MKKIKIYHNPRCSKSRQTLDLIKVKHENPEIIEYLKTPPNLEEIETLLKMLEMRAEDLLRKGENEYKELEKKYGK
ncbi:MAG: arsenate reductase (glutaredoxin), partial [Nanoarchaeota archaeon]|nr:arsenate reductase (glutaredoxin) [Nanoarchaeota archaeon]